MKVWPLVKRGLYLVLGFSILLLEQLPLVYIGLDKPWSILALPLVMLGITGACLYLGKVLGLIEGFKTLKGSAPWKLIGFDFLGIYLIKTIGGIILQLEGHTSTSNQESIQNANINLLILFVFVVIAAPIVEELVFRGILMGKVFNPGSIIGMLVSAFLFGFVHTPDSIGAWIIYGGMGLGLAYIYRRTHKLEHAIVVHMINNSLSFIFMLALEFLQPFIR